MVDKVNHEFTHKMCDSIQLCIKQSAQWARNLCIIQIQIMYKEAQCSLGTWTSKQKSHFDRRNLTGFWTNCHRVHQLVEPKRRLGTRVETDPHAINLVKKMHYYYYYMGTYAWCAWKQHRKKESPFDYWPRSVLVLTHANFTHLGISSKRHIRTLTQK